MSATVAAASKTTIKATLTKLKIYLGSSKLNSSVLTYNNVNYIPVNILSDKFGIKISTSTKSDKLTLTEKVSKKQLQDKVTELEATVNDLNDKLELYRGDIPEDSEYTSIINNFNVVNSDNCLYTSFWNKVTPFMVNGKVYDNNVYGIYFEGGSFNTKDFGYPVFIFKNPDLKYFSLKFTCAVDDLAKGFDYQTGTLVKVYGISKVLGSNTLLNKYINRGIDMETFEVNIKGYDNISVVFIPYIKGDSTSYSIAYNADHFYYGNWNWYKDYILFINPEVK
jgi:hypothetical protein